MIAIPPSGQIQLVTSGANAQDVAAIMVDIIHQLAAADTVTYDMALEAISQSCGDTVCDLAVHVYDLANFQPDTQYQTIRTPARLQRDGKANCVDYTVTLAALAKALDLPVVFRIAKFSRDEPYTHVYPVIDGVPVDLCIGQDFLTSTGSRDPVPTVGLEVPSYQVKEYTI